MLKLGLAIDSPGVPPAIKHCFVAISVIEQACRGSHSLSYNFMSLVTFDAWRWTASTLWTYIFTVGKRKIGGQRLYNLARARWNTVKSITKIVWSWWRWYTYCSLQNLADELTNSWDLREKKNQFSHPHGDICKAILSHTGTSCRVISFNNFWTVIQATGLVAYITVVHD